MSSTATKKMIRSYVQQAQTTRHLSGMFRSPPENFYNTESVELDIERSGEDIAVAITNMATGYRMNEASVYTNKSLIAPILKEAVPLNGFDLMKRSAGANPFDDLNFQALATTRSFKAYRLIEAKIRRTIELQASQILTTGVVTLVDYDGNTAYTLDYKPKSTHFPTTSDEWNDANPTIIQDLVDLCEVIRDDGLVDSDECHMGQGSWLAATGDTSFMALFEPRRANQGTLVPMRKNVGGGTYRGVVEVGNYRLDLWTYNGRYKHPQTGTITKYLPDEKVIVRASSGRLDATFGAIPRIVPVDSRLLKFLPRRISSSRRGLDLFPNAWVTPDGEQLISGVGSRPLLMPTAIDTYGCLDTDL